MAAVLSLKPDDIVTGTHKPQVASAGLPFIFTELNDRSALERVHVDTKLLKEVEEEGVRPSLFTYVRSRDAFDMPHVCAFGGNVRGPRDGQR